MTLEILLDTGYPFLPTIILPILEAPGLLGQGASGKNRNSFPHSAGGWVLRSGFVSSESLSPWFVGWPSSSRVFSVCR